MRIDSIQFQNFRCFSQRQFDFANRFTLIVGDNAKGKTSVLDGLAVGLGALFLGFPEPAKQRSIRRGDVRTRFIRHGSTVTAEPQFPVVVICRGVVDGEPTEWQRELTSIEGRTTRQNAEWMRAFAEERRIRVKRGEPVSLPIISYYGTGRLWVQIRRREVKTLKPNSRFMGYLDCLNPASDERRLIRWFKTQELAALQHGQQIQTLEACRRAIVACVPGANHVYFDVAADELMFQTGNEIIPFHHLSDGFRNTLAMVADIAVRAATLNPMLESSAVSETSGVVLIDEIDLHLHPKWQRRVVEDLLRVFPALQFVATTHSPFVIQSLPARDDVRLLNLDDEQAGNYVDKSIEDISEDLQGVELPQRSHRFLEMMRAAERYYARLRDAQGASAKQLDQLRRELDELSLPFSDDPAYQAFLRSQRVASGIDQEDN